LAAPWMYRLSFPPSLPWLGDASLSPLFSRISNLFLVGWPGCADHFAVSPVPHPEACCVALRNLVPRYQLPVLLQDGYVLLASILASKCAPLWCANYMLCGVDSQIGLVVVEDTCFQMWVEVLDFSV
jgi:hypothetical protein